MSLAPLPPQSLSGVGTTDLEAPSDLTFYCSSPINSISGGEDYPSPNQCAQPHEDLFNISMSSEANAQAYKDQETFGAGCRRLARDPVLSSKNFCFGMNLQQHQQNQNRQSNFQQMSLLNGSPSHSVSYEGLKFLSEAQDSEMEASYSRDIKRLGQKSPVMKEEPSESEVNIPISIYNM